VAKTESETKADPKSTDGMKVVLSGSPSDVRAQAQVLAGEGNGGMKPVAPEPENGIVEALRDPKNVVIVKRISPRRLRKPNGEDVQINCEVYREACPLVLSDIADEVSRAHGGRKYRVSVINPKGECAAAQTFDVDADPVMEDTSAADDELARQVMGLTQPEKSSAEMSLESLDREAKFAAKQFELEQAKQRLRDARGESGHSSKRDEESAARISKLERDIIETRYETKAAALEKELADLRRQIAEPKRDDSPNMMKLLMEMQQKSDERFQQLIQQMQNNRTDQLIAEVKALKSMPAQQGSDLSAKILEKAVDKFLDGDDDDDDADDPEKPWIERLADKFLPDIIDLVKDRKDQGKPMTKEEITAQITEAAKKAEDEAVAAAQRRIAAQQPPPRLTQQQPAPAPQPPPAPPPAPAPHQPTIEEEIVMRVGTCMATFDRESTLRVRDWEWSYDFWEKLPETILEKACAADSPITMLAAFDGVLGGDKLDAFRAALDADAKRKAWAERGLKELREWWAKAQVDPAFDPTIEDEEEDGS
jgi:hypothetical protein